MLDYRIRTFIEVCNCMNYTKAANKLGITQPAASQHIKYIEDSYKIKAFYFIGKKMFLTRAGKELFIAFNTSYRDDKILREKLMNPNKKKLSLGTTLSVGEFMIPDELCSYIKSNPNSSTNILVANTQILLNALNSGKIDMALIEGYFPKTDYDYKIFKREKYIAVCDYKKRFSKKNLFIEDLFSEKIVTREPGSGTREILENTLENNNYSIENFHGLIEISNMNLIKKLVEYDCGITFMYEAVVKEEIENKILKIINISDFDVTHDISFVWRKNSMFSSEYHAVLNAFI